MNWLLNLFSKPELITIGVASLSLVGVIWANLNSMRAVRIASKHKLAEFQQQRYGQLRLEFAELASLISARNIRFLENSLVKLALERKSILPGGMLTHKEGEQNLEKLERLAQEAKLGHFRLVMVVEKISLTLNPIEHAQSIENLTGLYKSKDGNSEIDLRILARKVLEFEQDKLDQLIRN